MLKKATAISMVIFACVNTSVFANTVYEDDEIIVKYRDHKPYYQDESRGWFFYEEPKIIKKQKEEEEREQQVKVKPQPVEQEPVELSPREILRKQGEEYEDATALAVLNPTPENYKNYLVKSQQLLRQAETFATGVEQYVFTDPNFDERLNRKQGADIQLQNQMNAQQKSGQLSYLAQDNALLFFYRSDCPYCHKYAPIIKQFASDHGFMVVPMALDNKPLLPEYPQFRSDNALARKLEVSAVPAVYLLNPKQNNVSTVGFGLSSYDELGNKILSASNRDYAKTQLSE